MEGLAYVDGTVVDLATARVPLLDRGYLLGDGLFETLRTAHGGIWRRDDHRRRVERGLHMVGLEPSLLSMFDDAVDALVDAGMPAFGDSLYLRVNITTGLLEDLTGDGAGAAVTGIVKPFKPYPMRHYSHGVQVIESRFHRDPASPLRGVKTLSFLPYIAARREALAQAAHDAVLTDGAGNVVEATTSNVFAFADGVVYAPGMEQGAVDGVTRKVVLELVQDAGLDVAHDLPVATMAAADEAWLTNTTGGIVPITRFGEAPVGDGRKGDLASRLGHAYEDMLRGR